MKISLNWLKDYVEVNESAEEVADMLSDAGFPLEGIECLDGDTVIDIEVSSNRGDCLSYIGVARELAAITGRELKVPEVGLDESEKGAAEFVDVQIKEQNLCKRYTARIIEGVKVGASPDWLKERLQAVGVRSVNNVVDATNYALMETGQPCHAFDYDKITGGKIVVRNAAAGERITSLDGSKCELDPGMLIIADLERPVAIAGVMGGLDSEVSEATTTILLEDAYFDPVAVRTTSRKLFISSESSFRFERTVDVQAIDLASQRTAQLIMQVAGGRAAKGVVDVYPGEPEQREVTLRISRLNKLLGIEVPAEDAVSILERLDFGPCCKDDNIACVPPSWRSDVYREVDLIEEVARLYGYDKVPIERKIHVEVVPVDSRQKLVKSIGTYLNACGFYETINVTFIDTPVAELFAENSSSGHVAVKDVSRKTANILRSTLIGSLLGVFKTNINAGNVPCRIFEIADTFKPSAKNKPLPIEGTKLAIVADCELRELRGVVEGLIKSIAGDLKIDFTVADLVWADSAAQIEIDGDVIGAAGMICDAVKAKFDLKDNVPCSCELDVDKLLGLQGNTVAVKPIPRFPSVVRDLSLIVDEAVAWADVTKAVNKKAPAELQDIRFVGIYRGKGISAGKKSLTLSLVFRDNDGTLTHEVVDGFEKAIVGSLKKSISAELRTV